MNNYLDILFNIAVDFKTDKSKVTKLSQEIEAIFSKISPAIDINDKAIKQSLSSLTDMLTTGQLSAKELADALSSFGFDIDSEEVVDSIKEISNLADSLAEDFKPLEDAFNNIDTTQLEDAFVDLDKAMDSIDPKDFENAVQGLAVEYDKATQEAQDLIDTNNKALAMLKASGKEGSDAYNKLEQEIKAAENELNKLGVSAKDTSSFFDKMAKFGLAAQGIEQITNTLNRFQEPFIELDKQVKNIGTLGVKNFNEFAAEATKLSKSVPDSAGAIAEGVYDAISAGTIKVTDGMADLDEGMKFVEVASKLATAGLTTTKDAINGLTSVMNAYGLEAGKAGEIADIFFGAVNVGKTTVPEMNAAMSQVIPTAAAFGVEFNQVAGAIATMTKQGVPTAQASTQMRQALVELAKPGTELAAIMTKAGVSLESLRTEGLQETMRKLGIAMEESGKSATQVFSSVEAGSAALLLSGKNAEMAASDYIAVAGAIGSTDAAFAIASEGIGNKTKMMLNSIQAGFNGLMGMIGGVGQSVLAATTQLAPMVTSFAGLSNLIPKGTFDKLAQFKQSLTGVSNQATQSAGIIGKMGPIAFNPWVLGTAAAVAGMYLFLTKTEKGQAILGRWGEAGERILNTLQPVINALSDLGETVLDVLIDVGENVFDLLITPFENLMDFIGSIVGVVLELAGAASSTGGTMTTFADIINLVGDAVKTYGDIFGTIVTAIKTANDFIVGFVQGIPQLLSIAFEYIQYFLNPINWVAGDAEYEKALSEKLLNAIDTMSGRAKERISNAKLDKALENALEIKGDLDKNKKLEELVKKFETTNDEIAKQGIAQEIAKQMPEAVAGYKTVIDENGKLVEVMDVSIDKVKEFAEKTKEALSEDLATEKSAFTEVLQAKANEYDLLSKKAEELATKIVQGQIKGQDTSAYEKQYNDIEKTLLEKSRDMSKNLAEGAKIGIEFDKIKFPENFEADFQNELNGFREEVKNQKFGEKLSEVVAIKGEIVAADGLDSLVEQYNKATDEMTRNSIAEKMKKIAPDAVKQVGVILDAEGKLAKQYEVQTAQVKESVEANKQRLSSDMLKKQNEYLSGLQDEADLYTEGKDKLDTLFKEIQEKQKQGVDTTELEKDYDKLFKQLQGNQEQLIVWGQEAIDKGIEQDKVYQMLADSLEMPIEKVKEIVGEQDKSKKKTEEQISGIKKLAEAWDNARQAASTAMNEQLSQTNQLYLEMQKETDPARKKELKEQYNESIANLKNQVKEKKNLDKIDEQNQIRAGLIEKQGKSAKEIAKEKLEIAKGDANQKIQLLEFEQRQYELSQKDAILSQGRNVEEADLILIRKKNIDTLKAEKQVWEDLLKLELAPTDKLDVEKSILDINQKLQDETQNLNSLKIKLDLQEEDINKQIKELENQKLEYEISIGIKQEDSLQSIVDEYKAKLQAIPQAIKESNEKIIALNKEMEEQLTNAKDEKERERIEISFRTKINIEKEKNIKLQQEEFSHQQTITNYQVRQQKSRLDRIKEDETKQLEIISNRLTNEKALLEKFNSEYLAAVNKRYSKLESSEEKAISKQEESRMQELDKLKDSELISAEEYERRKTEIQRNGEEERTKIAEDYANKMANLESMAKGRSIALDNEKAVEEAMILQKSLDEQISVYREKMLEGPLSFEDSKALEGLEAQLEDANNIIRVKGELLYVGAEQLGASLNESLTRMFAGDKEGAAKSLQDFFVTMSGIMVKGLTDYLNKIILDWVLEMLKFTPADPFTKLVLAPGFYALISGVVNAIAQPLLAPLSFATGGMVQSPTLAIVGDSAKLGEDNTEWIFRNSQLIATVQMAAASANTLLLREIQELRSLMASQQLTTTLKGSDIKLSLQRTNFKQNMRSI
jgi:TP901 family phage tail tape measure protein